MERDPSYSRPPKSVVRELARLFHRNGYVRTQRQERRRAESHRTYKKGDEVRLIAYSEEELAQMQDLVERAGFKAGRPYAKGWTQYCLPIYGRKSVARFLEMVDNSAEL